MRESEDLKKVIYALIICMACLVTSCMQSIHPFIVILVQIKHSRPSRDDTLVTPL